MKHRIKSILKKAKKFPTTWKYSLLRSLGQSDKKRWSKSSSFYESWDERTQQLVAQIPKDSKVLEFGAGRLVVENMLPSGCEYFHSDIVMRREDTIVADLNKELPSLPHVDFMIFSGVLEYVKDVRKVIAHCSNFTQDILLSYAICDEIASKKERRHHGWISDLYHQDVITISKNNNFAIEVIGEWKQQKLYHLKKAS